MQPIPDDILDRFNAVLGQKAVSTELQDEYWKWLRYYLDFRGKYPLPNEKSEHVRLFIEKMRSKGKSVKSLHHAAHALPLFFSLRMKVKPPESRTEKAGLGIPESIVAPILSGAQQTGQPVAGGVSVLQAAPAAAKTPLRRSGRSIPWSLLRTWVLRNGSILGASR